MPADRSTRGEQARKRYGMRVDRGDYQRLGKGVASRLQKVLQLGRVNPARPIDKGHYELHYFTTVPPESVITDEREPVPCIPIELKRAYGLWLVVELQIGRDPNRAPGEQYVEQISIKSFLGHTKDSAKLHFRAEWDARDDNHGHAQPHWNVHQQPPSEVPGQDFTDYMALHNPDFHQWLKQEGKSERPEEWFFDQVRMHFALGSSWHAVSGSNSSVLTSADDVTRWIGGCCAYIKAQCQFVADRQG